jgi:hypothetical protein
MPKPKRDHRAAPGPVFRYDDDFGFYAWDREAEKRLADAAESLVQHNDPRPLVKALLDLHLLPELPSLHQWLNGTLPPKLSAQDEATRQAVYAYKRTKFLVNERGRRCEDAEQKAKRVLDQQPAWRKAGVDEKLLVRVAGSKGREYIRIRDYHDAAGLWHGDVQPPKRTKSGPPNLTTRRRDR